MITATPSARNAAIRTIVGALLLLAALTLLSPAPAYAAGQLCATNSQIVFGDRNVGSSTTAQSSLVNCGDATLTLNGLESDPHSGPGFTFSTSCAAGLALPPSASCSVTITFAPAAAGQTSAGIREVGDASGDLIVFYGRGVDPRAGTATIVFTPSHPSFAAQRVGTLSAPLTVTLTNTGSATLTFSAIVQNGPATYDFLAGAGTTCGVGVSIAPNGSCNITFYFQPQAAGLRSANLNFDAPQLASLAILSLSGTGSNDVVTVDVIEYYNASQDHYFISSLAPDIDALDSGRIVGWTRTGQHFAAYPPGTPGANPVCRFYIPPELGNSHFFSASAAECAYVAATYTGFIEESAEAMDLTVPDPVTGICPAATDLPVYRVWDHRVDINHRYVTDRALRDAMVAQGWVAEGYGPDAVMMCSPGI